MTVARQILRLINIGVTDVNDIAVRLQSDRRHMQKHLNALTHRGYIKALPTTYVLTDEGQRRAARVLQTPQEAQAKQRARARANAAEEQRATLLNVAKRVPNSVWALGEHLA